METKWTEPDEQGRRWNHGDEDMMLRGISHLVGRVVTDSMLPLSTCCEWNLKQGVVFLSYTYEEIIGDCTQGKPKWRVIGCGPGGWVEIEWCPLCGTKLPDVEFKSELTGERQIRRVIDGGYYCDTCGERLHGCSCLDPAMQWEAVK